MNRSRLHSATRPTRRFQYLRLTKLFLLPYQTEVELLGDRNKLVVCVGKLCNTASLQSNIFTWGREHPRAEGSYEFIPLPSVQLGGQTADRRTMKTWKARKFKSWLYSRNHHAHQREFQLSTWGDHLTTVEWFGSLRRGPRSLSKSKHAAATYKKWTVIKYTRVAK